MAKKIDRGKSPSETYVPTSHFSHKSDPFDTLVEKSGYDIKLYKSTLCPCQLNDSNNAQATCSNCRGTGYIFYDSVDTKAIITSLNYRSKTHEWTVENMGTASITTFHNNDLGMMDKVKVLGTYSRFSQLVTAQKTGELIFSYLTYAPEEICEIFMFVETGAKLQIIPENDYELTEYGIKWLVSDYEGKRFSIRYKHLLEYLIIDLPHNIRQSTYKEYSGELIHDDFPLMGVGRLSHFALNMPDWDGEKLNNNDTK